MSRLDVGNADAIARIRAHDLWLGHPARIGTRGKALGLALVDFTDTLVINYNKDWGTVEVRGTFSNQSSASQKTAITPLTGAAAAAIIDALAPVRFRWRADEQGRQCLGFIAEDAPLAVTTAARTGVVPAHITAALVRVVKDQAARISALEARLAGGMAPAASAP